ncbi:MAG TPA: hypothetical protein VGF28_08735 [Thermoanaerobaculia bacterium]|jgi:hypothetical protein
MMNRTEYVLNALRIAEEQQIVQDLHELFGATSADGCSAKYAAATPEQRAAYDESVARILEQAESAFVEGARQMWNPPSTR